jgi:uncharacterized protein with PhoU and TrkA domain
MTSDPGFLRLEAKVDKLTDAVMRLVVIEERQTAQAERMTTVEAKVTANDAAIIKVDRKVDQWVNRGIGVWLAAVSVFALVKFGAQFFK